MKARIPTGRHAEVFARAAKGESSEQIAEWLSSVGEAVSDRAVRRLLAKTREFRGDAVKAKAREALVPHVTSDLDELDAIRQRLREYERGALKGGNLDLAVKAAEKQAAVLDKKLHYAGADEPAPAEPTVARVVILPPLKEPT